MSDLKQDAHRCDARMEDNQRCSRDANGEPIEVQTSVTGLYRRVVKLCWWHHELADVGPCGIGLMGDKHRYYAAAQFKKT
jgi:hypothetical protein